MERNVVLAVVGGVGLVVHASAGGGAPSTVERAAAGLLVLGGFAVLALGAEAARYVRSLSRLRYQGGE